MSSDKFDLVVIGAGPGGYVCAIRAAQLGLKVAIIEKDQVGGVCLNWGCIPTKALLKSAELVSKIKMAADFGIIIPSFTIDLPKMVARSREISGNLVSGIKGLLKKNKITLIEGHAELDTQHTIKVKLNGGTTKIVEAKNIVLATGSHSKALPNTQVHNLIWNAKQAMLPTFLPTRLLIIGSGAIGMEFASFYNTLGSKVTVAEMLPQILPNEDHEVSQLALQIFTKKGIIFKLAHSTSLIAHSKHVTAKFNDNNKSTEEDFDAVIVAIGISGNTQNLGFEKMGIKIEKGQVVVNEYCQTNHPNIYAIGDLVQGPWLAHKASHEGINVAQHAAGQKVHPIDRNQIPGCTYTNPQIASLGLSEKQAQALALEKNFTLKIGKFPFKANGKALAGGSPDGFIKTIFSDSGELLGAHMIGEEVTELISGFCIAKKLETTEQELMETIFPHPTLSEMMHESVLNAFGKTIHF